MQFYRHADVLQCFYVGLDLRFGLILEVLDYSCVDTFAMIGRSAPVALNRHLSMFTLVMCVHRQKTDFRDTPHFSSTIGMSIDSSDELKNKKACAGLQFMACSY
jgi:hypothetical protein